jgi:hypothetical protein
MTIAETSSPPYMFLLYLFLYLLFVVNSPQSPQRSVLSDLQKGFRFELHALCLMLLNDTVEKKKKKKKKGERERLWKKTSPLASIDENRESASKLRTKLRAKLREKRRAKKKGRRRMDVHVDVIKY